MHTNNIWEMRPKQSGILKSMPVTSWTFLIGTLALMGIPPLSGFFSKEEILNTAAHGPALLFLIAMAVAFLTAFYMGRLVTLVFFPYYAKASKGKPAGKKEGDGLHEAGWQIAIPLLILGVFSVIAGFLPFKSLVLDGYGHHGEHAPLWLAIASFALAASGFFLAFLLYRNKTEESHKKVFEGLVAVLKKKYFFDDAYDWMIRNVQQNIAKFSDWFEKIVVIEGEVHGTAKATKQVGNLLRKLQTGGIQFYAFVFTLGVTVLLYLFVVGGNGS